MRRVIHLLPIIVVVTFIGMLTAYFIESNKQAEEKAAATTPLEQPEAKVPTSGTMTDLDQALVTQVFNEPESLDTVEVPLEQKLENYASLESRPPLMSERKAIPEQPKIIRTSTNTPAYVEAFASLREDEVRNPDSEQNRAAVKSMMKKRQQRVSQLDRKIEL